MLKDRTIISVQYLRGLSALGVVFCHYGYHLSAYPRLSAIFSFGQMGVDVFFLISGFIIVYSLTLKNYKPTQFFRFLLKRSIRIDPPYYLIIILTLIFWRILYSITHFYREYVHFVAGQFVAHLFYYVPFTKFFFYNHIFWTLSVEFQFYLLIGLLYFLSYDIRYRWLFLTTFCSSAFIPIPNSENIVFNYGPIFALGISLVYFYQNRTLLNAVLPSLFLVAVWYKSGPEIFTLLLLSSLAILFFKFTVKPLRFLGDISYSLYLTHYLTATAVLIVFKHLHFNRASHQLLCLFCEVPIACGTAYIFYLLVERPSLRFSKKIGY